MAAEGNDQLLTRVAVFGITFSIICTMGLSVMLFSGGDYDYDQISGYRSDLIEFSGESMINQTPWVLEHVYTPWVPADGVENHMDDYGWLYGTEVTSEDFTGGIGESANIRLDPNQFSSVPLSVSDEEPEYTFVDGYESWATTPLIGPLFKFVALKLGVDPYTYDTGNAGVFNFTGYRYQFVPTLPYATDDEGHPLSSSKDGALNIVWYRYNGQEGLSGGLQVYGGNVLLASYSATDIAAAYNPTSGYATTYDFDFNGVNLTLSIMFDQDVLEAGTPLLSAFSQGAWTMAISSLSAGNFLDVEDSISFTSTLGGAVDTFIKIYTWDLPQIDNQWAMLVIWLMVGLPMTIAMLCIALRVMSAIPRLI